MHDLQDPSEQPTELSKENWRELHLPENLSEAEGTPEDAAEGLQQEEGHPAEVLKDINPGVAEPLYGIVLHTPLTKKTAVPETGKPWERLILLPGRNKTIPTSSIGSSAQ